MQPAPQESIRVVTESAVPKHVQLRELLLHTIRDELSPGDALTSERELMARHCVSRATVRRAVGELVANGVLVRTPGKGTFVARSSVESRLHLASFTDDMRRRGYRPSTVVLDCSLTPAPTEVSRFLGTGLDGRHWRLERLRLADELPMAVETGWYNAELLPGFGDEDHSSLYQLLRDRHGLVIDRAEQVATSQLADESTCRLLRVQPPAAVMTFLRRSAAGEEPVECVRSDYRGDRYSLGMALDGSMPSESTLSQSFPNHH